MLESHAPRRACVLVEGGCLVARQPRGASRGGALAGIGTLRLGQGWRWQESGLCDPILSGRRSGRAANEPCACGDTDVKMDIIKKVSRKVRIPATLDPDLSRKAPILARARVAWPSKKLRRHGCHRFMERSTACHF